MKFSTREDIEAPIAHVFEKASDFAAFERRALRHGARVYRQGDGPVTLGAKWEIEFRLRGRNRKMQATLAAIDAPEMYRFDAVSEHLIAQSSVTLVALSPNRTRILVAFDLQPRSLTARVMLQPLKLAKAKLTQQFKGRVLEFAKDIEHDYRNPA
ncbi:SRPBCC family protein [Yoonia sp.]|uniref:SRPBCC family protein n=1 Tax=Yoonia sp. TaxID=2212373 RepID=UPI0019DE0B1C|nr:SRPBCC family protein [Yoonia sp.]MBE0412193.1 SRPBCC family protein [Yoonia sp.]